MPSLTSHNPPSEFYFRYYLLNSPARRSSPIGPAGNIEGEHMENTMIRIKVQYDAVHRTFKLVDGEFKTLLEGDALYDLNVPLMYEEADVQEFIASGSTFISHG